MDIVQIFEEWEKVSIDLYTTVQAYCDCFYELEDMHFKEKFFQEEVNEAEEQDVKDRTLILEKEVQKCYILFLNYTKIVTRAIEQENSFNIKMINELNERHIRVVRKYRHVFEDLKDLEKDFKQPSSCIDTSKMNEQKRQLDKAIRSFNKKFPTTETCKLLNTIECEKLDKQRLVETIDWIIAHPDWE